MKRLFKIGLITLASIAIMIIMVISIGIVGALIKGNEISKEGDVSVINKWNDEIRKMDIGKRSVLFRGLITGSGQKIGEISDEMFIGYDKSKSGYWDVMDNEGRVFRIQLKNDNEGSTSVLNSAALQVTGSIPFTKF